MGRIAKGLTRFLGAAFIVVCALATLGTLVPSMPVLSSLGPDFLARFGTWIEVLCLVGATFYILGWFRRRRRRAVVWAIIAGFAATGTIFIQIRQIYAAHVEGVNIDIGQIFRFGSSPSNITSPFSFIYDTQDGTKLGVDVLRPAPPRGGALSPVIVYIHGGGWVGGSRRQREDDLHWFTERGYLVFSLDYSLSSAKQHFWDTAQPELGCGLQWVESNAGKYAGDPGRLALFGESAGGNLVLNVSYMANQGSLHPSCAGTLPHIAATIAAYPVVDVARAYRNRDLTVGGFAKTMATDYTGGSPEEFADRYTSVSSAAHINPSAPPTLLIVPEGDTLVAPDAAYAFAAQAQKAGVDVRLIKVPFAQHGFDLTPGGIGNQLVRTAALQFLDKHDLQP
jgi:acetyl esterase